MLDRSILRKAFVSSLPVLMGYLTMGFAAGVLLAANSGLAHPAFWGFLTAGACISGALQFLLVGWIKAGTALTDVAFLTLCLNIRYAMYGLSLLERFKSVKGWKKLYLIWGLTDETYALEVECKIPERKKNILYCLLLSAMNHSYWIIGVTAGAVVGTALPFSDKGIDFAMTALFLVILTEQCREKINRLPAWIGGGAAFLCLVFLGADHMLIPAMVLMVTVFLIGRGKIEQRLRRARR